METSSARTPRGMRLLQTTAFVGTFDRFAMPPMLLAIGLDLGASLATLVQVAGVYFLAYGLLQPVWGIASDRIGLVRTMRLTLLLGSLATMAGAAATDATSLAVARGLAGGFFAAVYPASLIYLGDTVPHAHRQSAITQLMVGVAIGTAAASLGAGVLADLSSWRWAFVGTGLAGLLCVLALGRLPRPSVVRPPRSPIGPLREVAASPTTRLVLLLALLEGAALLGALTLLPAAVEAGGASRTVAGAVTGVYGLAVLAGALVVGRIAPRLRPGLLIAVGGATLVAACALLAVVRTPPAAAAAAALLGVAWVAMHSSLQTWATEVLPGARATVVSLFAGSLFVGSALSAWIASTPADAGDFGLVFACAAAIAVPLTLLAVHGRSNWTRHEEALR